MRWPPGVCYLADCVSPNYREFPERYTIENFELRDKHTGEITRCGWAEKELNEKVWDSETNKNLKKYWPSLLEDAVE